MTVATAMRVLRLSNFRLAHHYLQISRNVRLISRSNYAVPDLRLRACTTESANSRKDKTPASIEPQKATDLRDGLRVRLHMHAEQLIEDHRSALADVLQAVQQVPEASDGDLRLIRSEISRLGDGFFMLVVAGEYNSGKSSLINALLGREILAEGPTPTTSEVTKLKYAERSTSPQLDDHGVLLLGEPVQVLASRLQVVDTPGTNAIDRSHEALTREFLPLCDIVLFVTSADRPFSESERLFLESIRTWGKKVVLIVNKTDLLESNEAKAEVMSFVSSSARSLLGSEPKVFALSARMAKQAKELLSEPEWKASGFSDLEEYITKSLDSVERLRLKLRASASIGTAIATKYISVVSANKSVVDEDRKIVQEIEALLRRHEESVRNGYSAHLARADNVLLETLERAEMFLDNHVRVSNVFNLSNKKNMERAFEDEVVKGTAKSVQRQVQGVAEWLSDLSSRNLTETTAIFSRRVGERAREIAALHQNNGIDKNSSSLKFSGSALGREAELSGSRERLVTRISEASEELSSDYISEKEGIRVAQKISASVRLGTGLGISALGSLSLFLVNSASLTPTILLGDPTIPIVSSVLGAVALAVVPQQRRALRAELRGRVAQLRARLRNELRSRLEEQLASHVTGIRSGIEPFSEFSDARYAALEDQVQKLSKSLQQVQRLERKLCEVEISEEKASEE